MNPSNSSGPSGTSAAPRRRWRVARWLFLALMALGAYGAWRDYAFREAIKDARALGWSWQYDDPFDALRKDWKAAFRRATWFEGRRELIVYAQRNDLARFADLVYRLRPRTLYLVQSKLHDLSVLEGLKGMREFLVMQCPNLTNVDAIKGLSGLQTLAFQSCAGLPNVDALNGLSTLQKLDLAQCAGLKNLDGLKGLTTLQELDLMGCSGVTNVEALKGLTGLKLLRLEGCTGLSAEAIADLRDALRNTKIWD